MYSKGVGGGDSLVFEILIWDSDNNYNAIELKNNI